MKYQYNEIIQVTRLHSLRWNFITLKHIKNFTIQLYAKKKKLEKLTILISSKNSIIFFYAACTSFDFSGNVWRISVIQYMVQGYYEVPKTLCHVGCFCKSKKMFITTNITIYFATTWCHFTTRCPNSFYNTSGTMSSPTISSTMAWLPILGKNFANSAPYGHHFHFKIHLVAQFQLCICSSQLQQQLNVFQAIVNIWTASGMYIFVTWPTLFLDNIHHTSCHLLHTSAAHIILCSKTKAQLGGRETTLIFSTCCEHYYARKRLSVRSRVFCLSGFIQHTHDNNPLWILHFPSMPLHYVKIHKTDKAHSWDTMSFCLCHWNLEKSVRGTMKKWIGGNVVTYCLITSDMKAWW